MFQVCVLGTSSAVPAFGRNLSAHVVQHNQKLFLLDCGEGTQFRLIRNRIRLRRLSAIFITHLHGDHIWGLAGLLTTLSLNARAEPLTVYGPKGLAQFLQMQFALTHSELQYPLEIVELEAALHDGALLYQDNRLTISCFVLQHHVPCFGYMLREKPKRRRLVADRAHADGIPKEYFHLLKQEVGFTLPDGREIDPNHYLGPPLPAYSYAYCTDTQYAPSIVPHVRHATLMYHEATFLDDMAQRAAETAHSTASQAADIARQAEVGQLIIGHFSARYHDLTQHLEQARAVFPDTHLAEEGIWYPIAPF